MTSGWTETAEPILLLLSKPSNEPPLAPDEWPPQSSAHSNIQNDCVGVKPVIYFRVQTQLREITFFPKQLLFGALFLCCRKWVGSNRRMRSWWASGTEMQSQKTWSALSFVTPKIKNVNESRGRWSQCLWKRLLTFKAFWVLKQTKNSPLRDRKCMHVVSVWNPNSAFFPFSISSVQPAL